MSQPDCPLWFLPAGNHVPVRSDAKHPPKDVTHWCRQGDREWTPSGGPESESAGRFVAWDELLGDTPDD